MCDLKPCPFCGADAKLYGGPMAHESYSVWCQGHLGGRHYLDNLGYREAAAIAAWNTRADDAEVLRLRAEVERLTEALEFYADESTYETQCEPMPCGCCSDLSKPIENDAGAIARAALKGTQ